MFKVFFFLFFIDHFLKSDNFFGIDPGAVARGANSI